MPYQIDCDQTISGDLESVWATWTDMASFPSWDPREETMRLDAPFGVGATGFSKQRGGRPGSAFRIVRVEPNKRWVNQVPLPGGSLTMDHVLRDVGSGRIHLLKRYTVLGPMTLAFRLFFARGIREEAPATFAALEAEAQRRRRPTAL
jgi:uncharacterized protein YndB with AHSA1/START domain